MPSPKIAYITLWYPRRSETFIFREVENLKSAGLAVENFALYGPERAEMSQAMRDVQAGSHHLGLSAIPEIVAALAYWRAKRPGLVGRLVRSVLLRRWSSFELALEEICCFFAAFALARRIQSWGATRMHAGWAGGPATAAHVASVLTGLPYSFSARAGDIHPPDGFLVEKLAAADRIHTNNAANIAHLNTVNPQAAGKIELVYNSLTLQADVRAQPRFTPHYRLLAVGRFCRTKGFEHLLRAMRILKDRGIPAKLTLVGAGYGGPKLQWLIRLLGLRDIVETPGFLPHDRMREAYVNADLLVCPSVIHRSGDRDGIPNVLMEASAFGLPVVATEVSGIPEFIEDGVTGRLVPERDPKALADAIIAAVEEPSRSLDMARAAGERVKTLFDPVRNTEKLLAFHTK